MKTIILALFSTVLCVDAFVVQTPRAASRVTAIMAEAKQNAEKKTGPDLGKIQEEWSEQAAHLEQYERSIDSDTYLEDLVVEHKKKGSQKNFMEKEAHRHDSLFNEVEHSIDTDPYLAGVTGEQPKAPNQGFMEREAHKHDSLLNEIEHSIDTDPYLS